MGSFNFIPQKAGSTESLPFVVRMASQADLDEVAALRSASYGKHIPELGASLRLPEAHDYALGCEVIVARSKLDDGLLGALRTHANVFKPLPLQASMHLPQRFHGARMVETTRLCVHGSPYASLVRSALFKALFQYCVAQKVDWMLAAGRRPVDRMYDALLFSDVAEMGQFLPMAHAGGVPHRVMCLSPVEAQVTWKTCQHPLYSFVMETQHPDIDLSMAVPLNWTWACPDSDASRESGAPPLSEFVPVSRYDYRSHVAMDWNALPAHARSFSG